MAPALLAFLVALAPAAPAQALLSKSPPIQVQKPQVQTKSKQPLALAPKITTVTPQTCVKAGQGTKLGDKVTLDGSNFGFPKPAGYTLAVQPAGSLTRTPVPVTSWTATSITFNVPSGLAAESNFTVGILSGTSFFSPTQLTVCARIQLKRVPGVMPARETSSPDVVLRARSPYIRQFEAVNPPSDPGGGPPEITSVSPADCVKVGSTATAHGVNLGPTKLAAGFSLGYQAVYEPPTVEINESTWSPTSVSFTVPPGAGDGGWFALGIIFESEFYAQQFVSICGAYTGQGGGYYGGGYDGGDYDYQDSGDGYVAGPKGARRLGPGGVDVQIPPSPAPDAPAQEQPQQPGKRAVGGKLLAMKALASRGLRKVNKECDLDDPHCPCCRKDDSVCLEKERDNEDGTSTWVVSWKTGAKTADGQAVYDAQIARDDAEAVTGLQCEPVVGGDEERVGGAKLNCR